jgi:methylated-DNA-[protein]-cysteine S-methyltransferase
MNQTETKYRFLETPTGKAAVVWMGKAKPKIVRIFLPGPNLIKSVRSSFPKARTDNASDQVIDWIQKWFEGKDWHLDSHRLDLNCCYDFQKKVLAETAAIPRGKVVTYGFLAARISAPNAARAVGTALGRNPFPLIIPCHRVVRSDGSLGGFGGGLPMKRKLLEMEGIQLDDKGRVRLEYRIGH